MSKSLRAIFELLFLIAVFGTPLIWYLPKRPDAIIWILRFFMPIAAIVIGWLLYRGERRKELLPDHLGQVTPKYFESSGLCFCFAAKEINGTCWMHVFFQNRYANSCVARIGLSPTKFIGRYALAPMDVTVECDGGAFGVVRVPWAILKKYQGRRITCQVGGKTKYPVGKGRLLRYREGLRAEGVPTTGAKVASAVATMALGLVGVIRISSSATFKFMLPKGVAETIPSGLEISRETLWRPDLPTGGFPVRLVNAQPSGGESSQ